MFEQDTEVIECEVCGCWIESSDDGSIFATDCQLFECPHSDPDREDHPTPLRFDVTP